MELSPIYLAVQVIYDCSSFVSWYFCVRFSHEGKCERIERKFKTQNSNLNRSQANHPMGGVRPKPFSRPTVHCKSRVNMKEILHAKRMIFEGFIFIPPPGGPRPPRVENLNDEDKALTNRQCRCRFECVVIWNLNCRRYLICIISDIDSNTQMKLLCLSTFPRLAQFFTWVQKYECLWWRQRIDCYLSFV